MRADQVIAVQVVVQPVVQHVALLPCILQYILYVGCVAMALHELGHALA